MVSVEEAVLNEVHSCRSVTIGDILDLGIKLDVFLYAGRWERNLTFSSMRGDFVLFIITPVF